MVTIANRGSDSGADGYKLKVENESVTLEDWPAIVRDGEEVRGPNGQLVKKLFVREMLYEKTRVPIIRGKKEVGYMRFIFSNVKADTLRAKGTVWTLFFKDVFDKELKATYVNSGSSGQDLYIPGLDPFKAP